MVESTEEVDQPVGQKRKFLTYGAILGTVSVMVFPLAYLYARGPSNLRIVRAAKSISSKAPPQRRVGFALKPPSDLKQPESPKTYQKRDEDDDHPGYLGVQAYWPTQAEITKENVLVSLKAFAFASLGLSVLAGAGITTLIWSWEITSIHDFSLKMRSKISDLLPTLSTSIYRGDTDSSSEVAASNVNKNGKSAEEWTWAGATGRLEQAYSQGGISAWSSQAIAELEAEESRERKQREPLGKTN